MNPETYRAIFCCPNDTGAIDLAGKLKGPHGPLIIGAGVGAGLGALVSGVKGAVIGGILGGVLGRYLPIGGGP